MAAGHKTPDPEALRLARLVQEAVKPDTVILFGSRARGDHGPDSDLDLMIVRTGNPARARDRALGALREPYKTHPDLPKAEIIAMSRQRFNHFSTAQNHVTAQALKDGIIMTGEPLGHHTNYDHNYPISWPDVKQRLQAGYRWIRSFDREFNNPEGEQETYGFQAQQAVENALKAWISGADLKYERTNRLEELAATILSDTVEKDTREAAQLQKLLDYTRTGYLNQDGTHENWLTSYAVACSYEDANFRMDNL